MEAYGKKRIISPGAEGVDSRAGLLACAADLLYGLEREVYLRRVARETDSEADGDWPLEVHWEVFSGVSSLREWRKLDQACDAGITEVSGDHGDLCSCDGLSLS